MSSSRTCATPVAMLLRNPGFATVAVLSLAVGIGAATTAFSVFNAVMLRPLPVAEPDRLVLIQPYRRDDRFIIFNPIYEDLRARQTTLRVSLPSTTRRSSS